MVLEYQKSPIILFLLLLMSLVSMGSVQATESDMMALMQDNRQHFLDTYSDWFNNSGSQNAAWLKNFLMDLDPEKSTSVQATISLEDRRLALIRLISLSKLEHVFGAATGYVEDKKLMPILIAALRETDGKIREIALKTLTWETRRSDLLQWSDDIKKAIESDTGETALLLLAQLPLTPEEQSEILSQSGVMPEIRARLGDKEAEHELIAEFEAEDDYSRKKNLAQRLGYVGTEASARALVDALRSPVRIEGVYNDRSIRCDVLLALGQIYQDEPLFTRDAQLLASNSQETFDRYRGMASYIADVDAWVQKNFGRSAWGENEVWFIRWRHLPLIPPETKK